MSTSLGIRLRYFTTRRAGPRWLWIGIALLTSALLVFSRQPSQVDVQALDPALMKAVQAAVSQRDVQAMLADRPASGPVHLQLYTSCDDAQRCTVFSTMDFPRSASRPATLSLHVAVQVAPRAGDTQRVTASAWEIRSVGPAIDEHIDYAGDFRDLTALAHSAQGHAMAGLLTSMESAIQQALLANGVTAKPDRAESMAAVY